MFYSLYSLRILATIRSFKCLNIINTHCCTLYSYSIAIKSMSFFLVLYPLFIIFIHYLVYFLYRFILNVSVISVIPVTIILNISALDFLSPQHTFLHELSTSPTRKGLKPLPRPLSTFA